MVGQMYTADLQLKYHSFNPIQTGLFWPSLDWEGGGVGGRQTPPPPPFLKNYKRYRHETYTTN